MLFSDLAASTSARFFGLSLLLSYDCQFSAWSYVQCRHVPQWLVGVHSSLIFLSVIAYLLIIPIVLVWALFHEMKIRQYEQFDD